VYSGIVFAILCLLREWEKVQDDCKKALELDKSSFKVRAAYMTAHE